MKPAHAHGQAGFSLIESLLALTLLLVVMAAVFGLVHPASLASHTQPEVVDVQQRARVAADALQRDLVMAGAGLRSGPATGPLGQYFAAVVPRRAGLKGADPYHVARSDAITVYRAAAGYVQTTLRDPLLPGSLSLTVNDTPSCPARNGVCGLAPDMTIVVFDQAGQFDWFTVRQIQNPLVSLHSHQPGPASGYPSGAFIAAADADTYWHDAAARQLRHYDGYQTDVPVADNVVSAAFEYFGDPDPPDRPKPPLGTANCLYDAAGNLVPGLTQLPAQVSLAPLPLSVLNDGPWCGAGENRFDADLLRVRSIRVTLRIQATQAAHRGRGADYANPGGLRSALSAVPDYTATFIVTPRNPGLGP
jgi:prepilin-type N-terminal cleavage/methylation domain-containing protein